MINTSPIGQTDLTSYFTWGNQMMYHQPLKISRAVEVGWDQSSSLYEEGDYSHIEKRAPKYSDVSFWDRGENFD
jgi:hypothetical protein